MTFKEALEALKQGKHITRPGWGGFWAIHKDIYSPTGKSTIFMHCKDGKVLDVRDTQDVFFTVGNMAENDWMIWDKPLSSN